jgi:transmembrane sensor
VYNLSDAVEALRAVAHAQGASMHRLSPWLIVISAN